jgi:hypothetical protein
MEEIKIELKDGYNTAKAIYYRNGNGSIFTYHKTRRSILFTSIFAILSLILFLVAFNYPETGWIFLLVICSVTTIVCAIVLGINSKTYLTWKRPTDAYLNQLRKYQTQWLTLTPHSLELTSHDESSIEKWENIKHVSFKPDSISMSGDNCPSYLFPEKSMEPDQFIKLKDFIRQRMNGVQYKIDEQEGEKIS